MQHLKDFWKHYVAGAIIIPSAFAAGLEAGQQAPAPFDCKGQECKVQVLVKEPSFNDAIYYTPAEWNDKTQEEIDTEAQTRYDNWKAAVEEQSQQTNEIPQN